MATQILTDDQYNDLGYRAKVERLEAIVNEAGICRLCGTHYSHDIEEPFANCGCHTTEWSGPLSPYQELEKKIYLAANVKLPPIPKTGERYKHHNGNEYEVVIMSNLDSQRPEYPPTVVYKGDNGKVWSKTLKDFNAKMTLVS